MANQDISPSKKIVRRLASLKLAVVVILWLGIIIAWGTIVESKYDALTAKKTVYDTFWMYSVMGLLAVVLIAVMVDRWPWKRRHLPFILAHIGILVLLVGSVLTLKYGIDGSMRIDIGGSSRYVNLPETEVSVFTSFDGASYTKLIGQEVDFYSKPPTKEDPIRIPLDEGELVVDDFYKYALANRLVVGSVEPKRGSGLRFQMTNGRANVIEWLVQRRPGEIVRHDFGPARVSFGSIPILGQGRNEIYLQQDPKNPGEIEYALFNNKAIDAFKKGRLKEGETLQTGWMGLEFRVLRFLPLAEEKWQIEKKDRPTPEVTTSALKVKFIHKDQVTEHWVLLNDVVKFFTDKAVYLFAYANLRKDLPFKVVLKDFKVTRYQGSMKAKEYESLVSVPAQSTSGDAEAADSGVRGGEAEREVLISMNEPMKHGGLTFYQASFQDGPTGEPVASILSVNFDPGRWWKYLGSLIMVVGIIMLFYFKQKARKTE